MSGEATAIVGIVVAGVVGPALGYVAGWRSDRRRFRHERTLKASDDLRDRIDDVAAALEDLGGACAEMRQVVLSAGPDLERVPPRLQVAEDAFQAARASIARLGMRPHADESLNESATVASGKMLDAIRAVRAALTWKRAKPDGPEATQELIPLAGFIEEGYAATRMFQEDAREAIAALLGPTLTPSRREVLRGWWAARRERRRSKRGG
jgi:hypothetical protein